MNDITNPVGWNSAGSSPRPTLQASIQSVLEEIKTEANTFNGDKIKKLLPVWSSASKPVKNANK